MGKQALLDFLLQEFFYFSFSYLKELTINLHLLMNKQTIIEGRAIFDLIPNREPLVMVDKLYHFDDESATSGYTIPQEHFFIENKHLTELGMIENIAQTTGLYVGMYRKKRNISIERGYIGCINNFKLLQRPLANMEIRTQVEVLNIVMGVINIKGQVFQDGECCAECEMKVFPPSNQ